MIRTDIPNEFMRKPEAEFRENVADLFTELTRQTNRELSSAVQAKSGEPCRIFEIEGDLYLAANAVWDPNYICPGGSAGAWFRIDIAEFAYLQVVHWQNHIAGEVVGGYAIWRAVPDATSIIGNWIYKYLSVGGWENAFIMTEDRNLVMGGMNFEIDGSGDPPFGRMSQIAGNDSNPQTLLQRNSWYEGSDQWGRDIVADSMMFGMDSTCSKWFWSHYPSGSASPWATAAWVEVMSLDSVGHLNLAGLTVGTLAGYIKGTAGILSGQIGVPWTDITGAPATYAPTAHNILSASHGDSTAASVVRGDVIIGSGATPKWARLAKGTAGHVLTMGASEPAWAAAAAGSGDVVGPAGATDNALARFDTATGKLLQDSAVTLDDTGILDNVIRVGVTGANSYDKLRVWNASSYTIGMHSAQTFGDLNDYAMTFTMSNTDQRGWLWRRTEHGLAAGSMSLSTRGVLTTLSDMVVGGELKGSRTSFVLGRLGSTSAIYIFLKAGDMPLSAVKGIIMPRAGSIVGMSLQYDVTAMGAKTFDLCVYKNGAAVWSIALSVIVGTEKVAYSTQARGIDTFAAGDDIALGIVQGGVGGATVVDDLTGILEVVYDT